MFVKLGLLLFLIHKLYNYVELSELVLPEADSGFLLGVQNIKM